MIKSKKSSKCLEVNISQLNNPLWPFPIHNGERTESSKSLLQKTSTHDLEAVLYSDPVTDTNLEEEAIL